MNINIRVNDVTVSDFSPQGDVLVEMATKLFLYLPPKKQGQLSFAFPKAHKQGCLVAF